MTARKPKPTAPHPSPPTESRTGAGRQTVDQEAVTWIAAHRPEACAAPGTLAWEPQVLLPDVTWFADARMADSIHGVLHNARVSLLVTLLAHLHGLGDDQIAALRVAAAVHDCRRRNDRTDPGHGHRSARWTRRNQGTVTDTFGLPLTDHLEAVLTAISLHDVPYGRFTAAQELAYRQSPTLTDLLKAADALDRYRLPHLRWWPDPTYLRVEPPDWLHPLACDLVMHSEQARIDGATHHQALTHAQQTLTPRQ